MRKLFAVLAVSTAVLTAYSAGADFNLVEEAQKIQNKQDEPRKLPTQKPRQPENMRLRKPNAKLRPPNKKPKERQKLPSRKPNMKPKKPR